MNRNAGIAPVRLPFPLRFQDMPQKLPLLVVRRSAVPPSAQSGTMRSRSLRRASVSSRPVFEP